MTSVSDNKDKLNLSADLRRVCTWLLQGNDDLVDRIIERDIKMYGDKNFKIGRLKIGNYLELIKRRVDGRERAVERALTASVILAS
jgi:hypothetical protein